MSAARACVFVRTGSSATSRPNRANHSCACAAASSGRCRAAAVATTYAGPSPAAAASSASCGSLPGCSSSPPTNARGPAMSRSLRRAAIGRATYAGWMPSLYEMAADVPFVAPVMVGAFDGWIDASGAATAAAGLLAESGEVVARFDADALYDYRARRPVLDVVDGTLARLEWPELTVRSVEAGGRHLLIMTGPEPDYHWRQLGTDVLDLCLRAGVVQWVSLGAIPAAVPAHAARAHPGDGVPGRPPARGRGAGPARPPARTGRRPQHAGARGERHRHPGRRVLRAGAALRRRTVRDRVDRAPGASRPAPRRGAPAGYARRRGAGATRSARRRGGGRRGRGRRTSSAWNRSPARTG